MLLVVTILMACWEKNGSLVFVLLTVTAFSFRLASRHHPDCIFELLFFVVFYLLNNVSYAPCHCEHTGTLENDWFARLRVLNGNGVFVSARFAPRSDCIFELLFFVVFLLLNSVSYAPCHCEHNGVLENEWFARLRTLNGVAIFSLQSGMTDFRDFFLARISIVK